MTNDPASPAAEVRRVVAAINEVWRAEDPDRIAALLAPYFADEIVIVGSDLTPLGSGRDAAIASYADFARVATIAAFAMDEPVVHVADGTAVATYGWRIRYAMDNAEFDESGHDVFVLRRDGAGWLATWRAMLAD
jgi:ketosteroid isomerase-like protein